MTRSCKPGGREYNQADGEGTMKSLCILSLRIADWPSVSCCGRKLSLLMSARRIADKSRALNHSSNLLSPFKVGRPSRTSARHISVVKDHMLLQIDTKPYRLNLDLF